MPMSQQMSVHMSVRMSDHRSQRMPECMSEHMSMHVPEHMSMHMSEHMPVHTSEHMPVHMSMHMSVHMTSSDPAAHCARLYTWAVHSAVRVYTNGLCPCLIRIWLRPCAQHMAVRVCPQKSRDWRAVI